MTLDGGKLPMQMDRVDEILNSAEIGIYRIVMRKGEHPRLQGSAKLRELLGVDKDCRFTEEEFYDYWYSHIAPADVLPQFGITECFIQYKCSVKTPPPHTIRSG